ncbi:MAG: efflux transporter outer membrane subunit [Alphaproteobacteria bacterium]|nr:efflux transporter outer membrane subunit [Alphaproteobacteria bacterium]
MAPSFTRALAGSLASVLAVGCTLTPPPQTPGLVLEVSDLDHFNGADAATPEIAPLEAWWRQIGGEALDEWVGVLRCDSLPLHEARLRAVQAREQEHLVRSDSRPAVSMTGATTTSRNLGPDGRFSWSEGYSAGLDASFDVDVFGRLRTSERAAAYSAAAAELAYRAAEQREIAALTRNWISAVALQRRLDLAVANADSFRTTFELTDQRYRAGSPTVSASDVQIARQNLDTALIDIPNLAAQLGIQLLVIDEQLARLPGESALEFSGSLLPMTNLQILVGQPADLLANRPDVAVAELAYLAALEDVGAARASFYPALSLSAGLTFQNDTPEDLFDWDRHIARLAASLAQPVFTGGRLEARLRLEQAQAEELAAAYARTTLAAVVDVEIALENLNGLTGQKAQLEAAVASARLSNEIVQNRYRQGLVSILAVLETQRSLNAAEQNLILTEQALANAQVDLFVSLGGDWTGVAAPSADTSILTTTRTSGD